MTAAALVIGKFLPPHAGHHLCVQSAMSRGGGVDIVVCDRPGQRPPADVRRRWLQAIHPTANVHVVDDVCNWHGARPCVPACSLVWARLLRECGLGPWARVHGSDEYVARFAAALGADAVLVDPQREAQPVSGAAVRRGVSKLWSFLHPVVQRGLTRRIVVLGVESSGSTTLAREIAASLGVPWVPEYGRALSAARAADAGSIWDVVWQPSDFELIAREQRRLEDEAIARWGSDVADRRHGADHPLLVTDTDILATAVWQRRYCGELNADLLAEAAGDPPALYVLTSPEGVDFEQDGLRDGEHLRAEMHGWFREVLGGQPVPWTEVTGPPAARLTAALDAVAGLVDEPVLWNPP